MSDFLSLAAFVGTRGRGSTLRAIDAAIREGKLSARIALVIGTKADAPAVGWAQENRLPIAIIDPKPLISGDEETAYANALLTALRDAGVDSIALTGYMRRLPSSVVAAFRHRIVNIHPALLPAFGGKGMYGHHVHEAVLAYGGKISGCTVHFVDETYDTGPVILQRAVPVAEGDTPETLAARLLPHEHAALIDALQLLAENRLSVNGRIVRVTQDCRL